MGQVAEAVVLVEAYDEHWYKVTEGDKIVFIPSVTTKLGIVDKPFLARWRGDIGNREADQRVYEAGMRGKRLHWARQILLTGGIVIYDPWQNPIYTDQHILDLKKEWNGKVAVLRVQDEMYQISKLQRQLQILKPMILQVEQTYYDTATLDAGTIDGVYKVLEGEYPIAGAKPLCLQEGIYIEDFKSGNFLDDKAWAQVAKYSHLFESKTKETIAGAIITHTGAQTKRGIAGLNTLHKTREELFDVFLPYYENASKLWWHDHKEDQPEQYQFPSLIKL